MRQVWSSLLLALSLLFTQQGAVWHELSHLRPVPAAPAHAGAAAGIAELSPDSQAAQAAEQLCTQCLAFAQALELAGFSLPRLDLLPVYEFWQATPAWAWRAAAAPMPAARDPPGLFTQAV